MTGPFDSLPTSDELARLQLGASLRKLRESANMKESALARAAKVSQSQISKIENGRIAPTVAGITMILAALRPLPAVEAKILLQFDLLDLPEGDYRRIHQLGIDAKQRQFRELELRSSRIRNFEMVIISGLLQTQDYARTILRAVGPLPVEEIDAAVVARMQRQELIWDTTKSFEFVMLEAALWSVRGSTEQHLAQLDRMLQLATRPNIHIGIIPARAVLPIVINSFWIFDDGYVSAETVAAETVAISPDSIYEYTRVFKDLRRAAEFNDAASMIGAVMREIESRE
jgi:transcriptional regulator with XRE-family HTH domain